MGQEGVSTRKAVIRGGESLLHVLMFNISQKTKFLHDGTEVGIVEEVETVKGRQGEKM